MKPEDLMKKLREKISQSDHPQELAVDVMGALQNRDGYLTDDGLKEGAELLGMTPLELEEIATFYDFIYREPVGKFVIHVCDGLPCWMCGETSLLSHLCGKLNVRAGEMSEDGLFTVLPSACIGHCDKAPAMLVNGVAYGHLTSEKIDDILEKLKQGRFPEIIDG